VRAAREDQNERVAANAARHGLPDVLRGRDGECATLDGLPRGLSPAELAGGFDVPGALPLSGRIEDSFLRRMNGLPAPARLLLLVAAAEPTDDPALVRRAAAQLGHGIGAAGDAEAAGLVTFGARARFRHPLVRSAVYRAASREDRQQAHRVLAEVASGHSADASTLLLATARQFEPVDPRLARETYLDALGAATFAGRLAGSAGLPEIAAAARAGPVAPQPPRAADLLLDGLALLITTDTRRERRPCGAR
jgi:hypothetical protein